jgi:4-hydroxybenzoate polyprenyltransferase
MSLTLDPGAIFLSLVVGGVGFVLFVYGKKQDRWPQLVAGIVLMVYPYFVGSAVPMLLVGVAIVGGLWLAVRSGY